MESNVVFMQKAPSKIEAEIMIKKLTNEGKISLTKHSKSRMTERDISILDVRNCLLKGKVIENPFLSQRNGGGWEITIERGFPRNGLRIGLCLSFSQKIIIITTIRL